MSASTEQLASFEQLRAMIGDLDDNRVALGELSIRCSLFRFTGGTIPLEGWQISRLTSYLISGSAMYGGVAAWDVVRYLALLEELNESQRDVANATRPRTLRARRAIMDAFEQTLSKAQSLGAHLELSIERGLESPETVAAQRTPVLFGKAMQ